MNKIKSAKAQKYIDCHNYVASDFKPRETVMSCEDVEKAIEIAEQDAEERFLEDFKIFITEWEDTPIQEWMIMEFMENFNNEKQSDE